MQGACLLAIGFVGGDEGGDGDGGGVGEEFGDLVLALVSISSSFVLRAIMGKHGVLARQTAPKAHNMTTHLRYPPDVLIPALLVEAQVLVQTEAHVVAIETVRSEPEVQQVLLERGRNGGFARGRQPRKPDGEAALLAECVTLAAGERRVPGNVAVMRV